MLAGRTGRPDIGTDAAQQRIHQGLGGTSDWLARTSGPRPAAEATAARRLQAVTTGEASSRRRHRSTDSVATTTATIR